MKSSAKDDGGSDGDSIEDNHSIEDFNHRERNKRHIHATPMNVLNPKRFLPPQRQRKSSLKPAQNSFKSSPPKTKMFRQSHSVNDLIDSDGNSLA